MSFSDDGWGIQESEVKVEIVPTKVIEQPPVVENPRVNTIGRQVPKGEVAERIHPKMETILEQLPKTESSEVFRGSPPPVFLNDAVPAKRESEKPSNNDIDGCSDDGWGSPTKKEEFRLPTVSKSTASKLPPARALQPIVPAPIDDTLDIESPRELSPAPPTERGVLLTTTSSRKGSDFNKPNSNFGKSFGTQESVRSENDNMIPKGPSPVVQGDGRTQKSFGSQKTNEEGVQKSSLLVQDKISKDIPPVGTVGSFGSQAHADKVPQREAVISDRLKPTGFGGSFGAPKAATFGSIKPSGFGSGNPTSFGSIKPSGFGGSESTKKATGKIENESQDKSTGFGNSDDSKHERTDTSAKKTTFGFGEVRRSFGQAKAQEPEVSEVEPNTETKRSFGFGKPTDFDSGSNQSKLSFGSTSQKPTSFGTQSFGFGKSADQGFKTSGATSSLSKQSAFDIGKENTGNVGEFKTESINNGFGLQANNDFGKTTRPDFGTKPSISFGGNKSELSNTGFGVSGNTGFGGKSRSGFGETSNNGFGEKSNNGFGTSSEFTKASFGSLGQLEKDGGFGDNTNSKGGGWGNESRHEDAERPRGCHNCGEEGHFSRDCDKPKQPRFPCRNCNVVGHFAKDCPEPRVPYGPCRNCQEEGHFSKDCTKERVRTEPTEPCRRCNEEGHWSSECPSRPRDLQGNILVSYDVVFTPEDEMFEDAVNNDDKINFDQKVFASMGEIDVPDMASFDAFKVLPQDVHDNLKRMKMNRPTPIQRASFFPILHGFDVVACAHTGSGKTLAFLIPLVINLLEDRSHHHDVTDEKPSPRLLVVAPTRELASQTFNTARQLTYQTGLKCGIAYGGYSRSANLQLLRSFDQLGILVATMGRLNDFLESDEISLSKMKFVVLDEADRMVDSADFGEEVSKIIGSPETRTQQTILFSASFSENLQAEDLPKFVKEGYTMLQVDKFGTANEKIDQRILPVPRTEKRSELYKLLGFDENTMSVLPDAPIEKEKTLIFVNSVKFCDTLASNIANCGVPCTSMHSHQNQEQRDRTLDDFRRGKYKCMVASNVCARGLNIAGLDHVINYDMPDKKGFDEYVNRIGRTARAGFTGVSTAFIDEESDREIIPSLINVMTEANKKVPEWLVNINEGAGNADEGQDEQW
ncbi:hypothetical protein GCK72_002195 [Caenorhabditis remanei]|uniref:RNA helicase n=1 Tax=Caenorhabditis remanei TaxID=31234 RepID=A0A6A5HVS6_CAERE|nr:hypothetical protein GCK72_002195 [Caenorhabditis remanei]KAF1770377.1 hypothetical protein GCK72_002195 [Caenorhabditis remanei]